MNSQERLITIKKLTRISELNLQKKYDFSVYFLKKII